MHMTCAQIIQNPYFPGIVFQQVFNQVRADKSGSSCNKK